MAYKLSVTAAALNTAITQANNAAPQSTTYTKTEVNAALLSKQATLVVGTNLDNVPTISSDNPVTSGGVYTGLAAKVNLSDIPTEAQIDAMFA